jgi:two-component system sensor histidine kinase/response regulator
MMGGAVGVESEPGKGSTFWFTARLGRSPRRRRALLAGPELRGRRVLVIDDNTGARDLLSSQLRRFGFDVQDLASGLAAVDEVVDAAGAARPYEIVFLDWRMPGCDGVETARRIRALGLKPAPHLIMVTAFDREHLLRHIPDLGVDEALVKPVTASTLLDTATRVLAGVGERNWIPADTTAPTGHPGLGGTRVLLVEDHELNREVATELLAAVGVEVEPAANGRIAIEKLATGHFDAVLMDMQMPVMDGLAATREIRADPRHARLPIIAMTANAMASDREQCLAAGMNDHVPKPIEPEELWQKLAAALGRQSRAISPPPAASAESQPLTGPVAGLDIEQGLRRVGGSHALYLTVLRKFAAGHRGAAVQVSDALAAGDRRTAERLAHSLKGVAATLGAEAVKADAAAIESALHGDAAQETVDHLVAHLAASLGGLITRLERRLPAEPGVAPTPNYDHAEFAAVRAALEQLLVESRFEAGGLLERHRALLHAGLGEHYAALAAAVQAFDYEAATRALQDAATGVPPPP